jgi:hypothetical protein
MNARKEICQDGKIHRLRATKKKGLQANACNPFVLLVRLAGIEPTTPWFVAKYSIQLSYSREK